MKQNSKRSLCLLLACGLLACTACQSAPAAPAPTDAQDSAGLPNPLVTVSDPAAFEPLGVRIDAPTGAQNVVYVVIADEIAQVQFTLDGRDYTYRASLSKEDIAGVYETFDNEAHGVEADGTDWHASVTIRTIDGGKGGALASFAYDSAQYTLFTSSSVTVEAMGDLAVQLAEASCPKNPPTQATAAPDCAVSSAISPERAASLSAMQPVLDSILRTVGVEQTAVWPAQNADTGLFTALYLLAVNWRSTAPGLTIDGGTLFVPRQRMNEWAGALGEAFSDLPELPTDADFLRYDPDKQVYAMELSDMGASSTYIEAMDAPGDGVYHVTLGLYDESGVRLGGLVFTLVDNPFLDGATNKTQRSESDAASIENPEFLYAVRAAGTEPVA